MFLCSNPIQSHRLSHVSWSNLINRNKNHVHRCCFMVASNEIIKIMVKSAKSYEVTISLFKPSWNVQMVRKHNSTFTAGLRIKWQSKKGIQLRNSTPTTPQWSQCRCDRSTFGMGIGGCKMVAATMDRMKSMNIMWLVQRLINVSKTVRCGLKVAYLKCKSRT